MLMTIYNWLEVANFSSQVGHIRAKVIFDQLGVHAAETNGVHLDNNLFFGESFVMTVVMVLATFPGLEVNGGKSCWEALEREFE
ncbi:hypothetical protein L2E82_01091 [Cichorium intybus]|uniref:Uncharacterized protein n=1 Tax=Cichorium intybus TaxID=13427 RepID=A0ACB9GZC3_CICIN|nr:hypothetical protein L2E82_01091 [Cichorium intybus]